MSRFVAVTFERLLGMLNKRKADELPDELELLRQLVNAHAACWDKLAELEAAMLGTGSFSERTSRAVINLVESLAIRPENVDRSHVEQLRELVQRYQENYSK